MAKAVVKSSGTRSPDNQAQVSDVSLHDKESPRTSLDTKAEGLKSAYAITSNEATQESRPALDSLESSIQAGHIHVEESSLDRTTTPLSSTLELAIQPDFAEDLRSEGSSVQTSEHVHHHTTPANSGQSSEVHRSSEEQEAVIAQLHSDYAVAELRRQEETHTFIERIDALQAKLQYLTREALNSAKTAISVAPPESPERKLAEKDEKIALLLDEGQKLSKTELRHSSIIKKLRSTIAEDQKQTAGVRMRLEKAEREMQNANERAKRAEDAERRGLEQLKASSRVEKQKRSLEVELDSQRAATADLKAQLALVTSGAKATEIAAEADALATERRVSAALHDELTKTKTEKDLLEEKLRSEIRRIQEDAEREKERARTIEAELRGEQSVRADIVHRSRALLMSPQMLESRLEMLHARAEEVSTGTTSDSQTKLLRQIEVLQTQYALANENWQGIEGSLLHKIKNLEEERDEVIKREADIRRKARDLVSVAVTLDHEAS